MDDGQNPLIGVNIWYSWIEPSFTIIEETPLQIDKDSAALLGFRRSHVSGEVFQNLADLLLVRSFVHRFVRHDKVSALSVSAFSLTDVSLESESSVFRLSESVSRFHHLSKVSQLLLLMMNGFLKVLKEVGLKNKTVIEK